MLFELFSYKSKTIWFCVVGVAVVTLDISHIVRFAAATSPAVVVAAAKTIIAASQNIAAAVVTLTVRYS